MNYPGILSLLLPLLTISVASLDGAERPPNVLVILADDLGYADVGFQGCKDIPTPNLDKLAARSLRCTSGYVTHPFCSPSRAGLLTGRYQQRFGHENNPVWNPADEKSGLPVSETTLPQVLKSAGYATAAIGKWHLGAHPQFHPNKRGFDDYVGFLGGGHNYFPAVTKGAEYSIPINRNGVEEPLKEYLTDFLGHEAAKYIQKHREGSPWFLYLAFNAPHTPLQAMDKHLDRVRGIQDETRRNYGGLVVGLDDAVGEVLGALHDSDQDANTLVFFLSDNGGPVTVTHSSNAPLRGAKGSVFEGGMRVPFLISWPGRLGEGKDYAAPVSSLDIFATTVALAGAKVPEKHHPEGVNLMPFLTSEKQGEPHDCLFWHTAHNTWAARDATHKLLNAGTPDDEAYDLTKDIAESHDVATAEPDAAARLKSAYAEWNKSNIPPVFQGPPPRKGKKKGAD